MSYQPEDRFLDPKDPAQARELVERHLRAVTHRPHRPRSGEPHLLWRIRHGESQCPFCEEEFGCQHLIGEGDDQIIWQWDVIDRLRRLCEEADLMKIDIGRLAKERNPACPTIRAAGWRMSQAAVRRRLLRRDGGRRSHGDRMRSRSEHPRPLQS